MEQDLEITENFLQFIQDRSETPEIYKKNIIENRDFFTDLLVEAKKIKSVPERFAKLTEINPTLDLLNGELVNLKNPEYQVGLGKKCRNLPQE